MPNPTNIGYSVINNLLTNMNSTGQTAINTDNFATVFAQIFSSANDKEDFYNQLCDKIAKVTYYTVWDTLRDRGCFVDPITFGGIYNITNADIESFNDSSEVGTIENPYNITTPKTVTERLFKVAMGYFSYVDVISEIKSRRGFHNLEEFSAFTNMLYDRMYNAMIMAKNDLISQAVATGYCKTFADSSNANYARRVRNVLTEYNTLTGTPITATQALHDEGFGKYLRRELNKQVKRMMLPNKLYNDGSFTCTERTETLVCEVQQDVAELLNEVYAQTYHDDYLKLPNYNEIPYWCQATDELTCESNFTTDSSSEEAETVTIDNLIATVRSNKYTVATFMDERNISYYDEWNDRTLIKATAGKSFIVDTKRPCVLFVLA